MLALEPLLQKLEAHRSILREPGHGGSVTEYADDITIIISKVEHLQGRGGVIKEYKMVARVKVNYEKSISLQLGTCRDKSMAPNSIVRC